MTPLVIDFDGMPELPNARSRMHWAARGDDTRAWRKMAWALAVEAATHHPDRDEMPWRQAAVAYTFKRPDQRVVDIGNMAAAMKPVLDGIVDAKVLLGDSSRVVVSEGPHRKVITPIFDEDETSG